MAQESKEKKSKIIVLKLGRHKEIHKENAFSLN